MDAHIDQVRRGKDIRRVVYGNHLFSTNHETMVVRYGQRAGLAVGLDDGYGSDLVLRDSVPQGDCRSGGGSDEYPVACDGDAHAVLAVSGPVRQRPPGGVESVNVAVERQDEESLAVARPGEAVVPNRADFDGDIEETTRVDRWRWRRDARPQKTLQR